MTHIGAIRRKNLFPLDSVIHFPKTYPGGGGVLLGILGEGVPPGSPNPDLISDQSHFPHPFSDLASKKLCRHYLD